MLTHRAFALRRLGPVTLLAWGGMARPLYAQEPGETPVGSMAVTQAPAATAPSPAPTEPVEATALERRTLGRFFPNFGRSVGGVFSKPTLAPLLIGGAVTGLGSLLDDSIHESISHTSLGDTGATFGGPLVSGGIVLGLFVGGRFAGNGRFQSMTYDFAVGTLVDAGYFQLLKVAVRRERPDGSNNQSFPSGHTSHAFMMATIARKHYGWKLGAPMYALAGLIGYSRLNKDVHWFSDVLAGATLGYIAGITVVRQDDKPLPARHTVAVTPVFGPAHQRGLQVTLTFR